jgi:signal transduction histidine kinase
VDDEMDNVEALERLFRKKFRVLKATSGPAALKILQQEPEVCLIISDQRMPEMTGVDLLARTLTTHPDATRILLTGYTDIESVISAINSGQIYRYLTKPWDPVDLVATVESGVERYRFQHELKIKNQALEKAVRELQSLDKAKSDFMILINHELKTPLTGILSYMQLLFETNLDNEQRSFLEKIQRNSDRLQDMINDTLTIMSAETGQYKIKSKSVDTYSVLTQIQEGLAPSAKLKGQSIQVIGKTATLTADPDALKNILTRLTQNAIKYGKPDTAIELLAVNEAAGTQFKVKNHGPPVPPLIADRIAKPFNISEDIMKHTKGNGLGLSVSQALLRLFGGRLEFENKSGQTVVSFTLPHSR